VDTLKKFFQRGKRGGYVAAELPVYYPGEDRFAPDPEYFIYDRGRQRLWGYHLISAKAAGDKPILPQLRRHGSEQLDLDLTLEDEKLRFYSGDAVLPESGELIAKLERLADGLQQRADAAADRAKIEAKKARSERRKARDASKRAEQETKRADREASRRREESSRAAAARVKDLEEQLAKLRRG